MSVTRSGPLASWSNALFAGQVTIDQVIDAVTGRDAPHGVGNLPGCDADPVPLRDLLTVWRRAAAPVRAVLPVAGDVRGLAGPAAFRSAALDVREAAAAAGIGVVPHIVDFAPSSAPTTVLWNAFAIDPAPMDHQSVEDAQYELSTAIRDSATALAAADVARWMADIADALTDARRAGERLNLPPGFPPRAVALLAQAERLRAVLDLALADPVGGAVDCVGIAARDAALRPLALAVRRARVAGYNAGASA